MKRQRVSTACQKCRVLKAKCDGRRPRCSRCEGYGFTCTWMGRKNGTENDLTRPLEEITHPSIGFDEVRTLSQAVQSYEALVQSLRPKLGLSERAEADLVLEGIRKRIPTDSPGMGPGEQLTVEGIHEQGQSNSSAMEGSPAPSCQPNIPAMSPTYLGKASDIRFFNTIREFMREEEETSSGFDKHPAETYDQSHTSWMSSAVARPLKLPTRTSALMYLDIYFSTIHIAYPFLCKPMIFHHWTRISKGNFDKVADRLWLALLSKHIL